MKTHEELMELVKANPEQYEIRTGIYGGLVLTSEMIKAKIFLLEQEQHYKEEQEKHDLLIYTLTGLLK